MNNWREIATEFGFVSGHNPHMASAIYLGGIIKMAEEISRLRKIYTQNEKELINLLQSLDEFQKYSMHLERQITRSGYETLKEHNRIMREALYLALGAVEKDISLSAVEALNACEEIK